MTNDTDISLEAVDRTINDFWERAKATEARQAETMIRALSAALTQSRAETAAGIEASAILIAFHSGPIPFREEIARKIRAIATPDQSSALAAIEAAAEARGMRKAAVIAYQFEGNDKLRCAILAAIPQKDAPND